MLRTFGAEFGSCSHLARGIHVCGLSGVFDGMQEKILPDFFVEESPLRIFSGSSSGHHRCVGALGIIFHVATRDQSARVLKGRLMFVDIDQRAVFVESEQLP